MNIRQAEEDDLELIERDVKAAVGRSFELEMQEQARGIHSLFIVLDGEEIVGWGFIRWSGPRDPQAMKLYPDAPEIYRLEIRESLRSSGIGRELIAKMESAAAYRGFSRVSLGVGHENPRACSLYRQLGYEETELEAYVDEYEYPLKEGGFGTAKDLCRFLVKRI
jgi:ribosomal protein S18 acetylase RimI-like enzyme